MGSQKKWRVEEKLAIVLDGLKGRSVREIVEERNDAREKPRKIPVFIWSPGRRIRLFIASKV